MHLLTTRICGALTICALFAWTAPAAPPIATSTIERKPIAFAGRVESIDMKLHTVAIRHGIIPGYMPAMTMDYPVDSYATLRHLAPADDITATVYVGDPVLHDVHVLARGSGDKPR
jgi:Cu/Ag efflux protein CusF